MLDLGGGGRANTKEYEYPSTLFCCEIRLEYPFVLLRRASNDHNGEEA